MLATEPPTPTAEAAQRATRPRADDRRRLIARAAVEVLGRYGGRGFTHRAIDRELSLPLGTTSAYFRSRSDLMLAAFGVVLDDDIVLLEQHFGTLLSDTVVIDAAAVAARLQDFAEAMAKRGGAHDLARIECYLLAQRQPELRERIAAKTNARETYWVEIFRRLGADRPQAAAGLFDTMIRGMFYRRSLLAGIVPTPLPRAAEFRDMLDLALRRVVHTINKRRLPNPA